MGNQSKWGEEIRLDSHSFTDMKWWKQKCIKKLQMGLCLWTMEGVECSNKTKSTSKSWVEGRHTTPKINLCAIKLFYFLPHNLVSIGSRKPPWMQCRNQVWPLTNFFLFPFCENHWFAWTPHRGEHYSLPFLPATPSSPSRTLEGLFELTRRPSRALDSPRNYRDTRTPSGVPR